MFTRKREKLLCTTIIAICIALIVNIPVLAYPSTDMLNISSYTQLQQKSNWCWAACSVTALKYYGKNLTQTAFVNYVYDTNTAPNNAANMEKIKKGLKHWKKTGTISDSYVGYSTIISNIYNGNPIFAGVAYNNNSGAGHMLLIVGYDGTNSTNGYVGYFDPGDNSIKLRSYSSMKNNNLYHWVQSIKSITTY